MNKLMFFMACCFLFASAIEAHPGIGIVMDDDGNVFYTDLTHVWKISPSGTRTIAVKNVHTHELYLDSNGDLYGEHEWYEGEATDKWGNYVWCLSKDGLLETVIPEVEGILDNTTLVRDQEGNSYWTNHSGNEDVLMKQTLDGRNRAFTSYKFDDIRWMHYSKYDDNLYVVDHLAVKKIAPSGSVEILAADLKENIPSFGGVADRHYVFGLWIDRDSHVYVALYGAGKVKKISPSGEVTTIYVSKTGWAPCSGMMDKNGSMWIMEFSTRNTTRVRKIIPNGEDILYES